MAESEARTHAMRALIELRRQILAGDLAPGSRLLEVPIAEQLSISRTPVREAMSRLVEEGLLERQEGSGFRVVRFGVADVIDAIEVRGVFEGTAARLAAERGVTTERLDSLWALLGELDGCFGETIRDVDFERYAELNTTFHQSLAGLCGSAVIQREVERAVRLPFAAPSAFLPSGVGDLAFRQSLLVAQDQHRTIVGAIAAREGARAEAVAREHARLARRNLEALLAAGPQALDTMAGLALVVD